MQKFKETDALESQITNLFLSTLDQLGSDRDTFFEDAYEAYGLGDVLYDLGRDPLVDVITRDVYRTSYPAIHDLFTRPGTFEFYLAVFRRIFPDDVDIQFSIPNPGELVITINALTLEEFNILTRRIVDGSYVYDTLVTSDLNEPILGHGAKGIKTQSEIDALMVEISAYGVYTTAVLTTP